MIHIGEYVYFSEEQKLRAGAVDLEEFLRLHGERLIRSGRDKRLESDHSVRGNEWYDHAAQRGGGPVSFVQQFYRKTYPEAMALLLNGERGAAYPSASEKREEPRKPFELPPKNGDMIVPIIQSITGQLQKNYGKEGAEIIVDNCQVSIFGGFAPGSQTAQELSKSLGSRTVLSGYVSKGKDTSQTLQMMERPLMTPDELKSMPKGSFVVTKTGVHPMRVRLRLFLDWGIRFGKPYEVPERAQRPVAYAEKKELENAILRHKGRRIKAEADTPEANAPELGGIAMGATPAEKPQERAGHATAEAVKPEQDPGVRSK